MHARTLYSHSITILINMNKSDFYGANNLMHICKKPVMYDFRILSLKLNEERKRKTETCFNFCTSGKGREEYNRFGKSLDKNLKMSWL